MTIQIDPAQVIDFSSQVDYAVQQMTARLKPHVSMRKVTGKDATHEGMGTIDMVEINGYHQKTVGQDIASTRRRIRMREFRATVYLDKFSELTTIIGPNSAYAKMLAAAAMRQFDTLVIRAALDTVYTGKDMTTAVSAAADGVVTVDATAGLTAEIVTKIEKTFMDNEVTLNDPNTPTLFLGCGDEHSSLKNELQFSNQFYANEKPFATGHLTSFSGVTPIWFGRKSGGLNQIVESGSTRNCIAMTGGSQPAVEVGMLQDVGIEVNTRADLNNLTQLQASLMMGATRTQGARVQQVNTTVQT